jgi:hypothetical protein
LFVGENIGTSDTIPHFHSTPPTTSSSSNGGKLSEGEKYTNWITIKTNSYFNVFLAELESHSPRCGWLGWADGPHLSHANEMLLATLKLITVSYWEKRKFCLFPFFLISGRSFFSSRQSR